MKKFWILLLSICLLTGIWVVIGIGKDEQVEGFTPEEEEKEIWVGSWTASPQYPSGDAVAGISDRTVRMVLRPHLDGEEVRVRLSNAFGEGPVTFGEAIIAHSYSGARTIAGTQKRIAFNGKPSVTVEAGQSVVSDPVSFPVSRFRDVVVSLYISGDSGPITWHRMAKQTSYISNKGNFAQKHREDAYVKRVSSWYWLTGLDVIAPAGTGAVVCLGDSITDGAGSSVGTNSRYPDVLSRRLNAVGIPMGVMNGGISGNRLLRDDPVYGPAGLNRFERDVLEQPGVTHVILLEGINDIGREQGVRDPDVIINGMRQMINQVHERGLKIHGGTLTPFQGTSQYTEEANAVRITVNDWIRNGGEFDGVIDFEAALRDPEHPNRLLAEYDSGDHLHPSDAGFRRMAEAVDLDLFR